MYVALMSACGGSINQGNAKANGDPAARVAIGLQFLFCCHRGEQQLIELPKRRRGREAEGGGLLNRYTVKSRIEGSNPSVSAILRCKTLLLRCFMSDYLFYVRQYPRGHRRPPGGPNGVRHVLCPNGKRPSLAARHGDPKKKLELKPANFYQACIYAWNAYREDKTITSVKYDTKKGVYAVAA